MPFLDECELHFGSRDLYVALGVSKRAGEKEIKVAYRKKSLIVHPDRVAEDEKGPATEKFQVLGKVYNILSNDDLRKIYDETGCADDDSYVNISDWKEFWATRFGDMNEVIKQYTSKYWGSKEEENDLKKAYVDCKGDMNKIVKNMYCRVVEHEPRYRELIKGWIEDGEVEAYKAFTEETDTKRKARKRRYEKQAKTVKKNFKTFENEMMNDMPDISQVIAQRNERRLKAQDAFLDRLAEKYAKPAKTKKKSGQKAGTSKKKSK